MYFSPHLEVICLIGKEIICRSYSPPRGRNPAAQPCTSNLKQKNKHFYPRSPSIFPLFSSEIQFKLKLELRWSRLRFDESDDKFLLSKKKKFSNVSACCLHKKKVWRNFKVSIALLFSRRTKISRFHARTTIFTFSQQKGWIDEISPLFGGKKRTHSAREKKWK